MYYVTNAIPGMLIMAGTNGQMVKIEEVTRARVTGILNGWGGEDSVEGDGPSTPPENWVSAIGHADTAKILAGMLNCSRLETPNRISLPANLLAEGNTLIACLYDGPRLPEGSTTLPDGARFRFALVRRPFDWEVTDDGGATWAC